jgi:hypothetical protein
MRYFIVMEIRRCLDARRDVYFEFPWYLDVREHTWIYRCMLGYTAVAVLLVIYLGIHIQSPL